MTSAFLTVLKFLEIKDWDVSSGGKQFCKMSELFDPPFCILILKVFMTEILRLSLEFTVFIMIEE